MPWCKFNCSVLLNRRPYDFKSMRDRVSSTPFESLEWLVSLILFNSGCLKFDIVYQVFTLSFLARVLSREKLWIKWRPYMGHHSAFLSYSQGEHIAERFNAVIYKERSPITGVENTRRFLRELFFIALHSEQGPYVIRVN